MSKKKSAELDEAAAEHLEARSQVRRTGEFAIFLVEQYAWFCSRPDTKFPAYENILRPLLEVATECWVYKMKQGNAAFLAANGLLEPDKGKWRVKLEGDPLRGHLRFWNASGGLRGSIVIVIPRRKFDAARIFPHAEQVIVRNSTVTGNTPAAVRFARQRVRSTDDIVVSLPANNGINWMDIYAKPKKALALMELADQVCRKK